MREGGKESGRSSHYSLLSSNRIQVVFIRVCTETEVHMDAIHNLVLLVPAVMCRT